MDQTPRTHPRKPWTFDDYTNSYIRRAAATGIYDIRGGGSKRRVPHFDDLLFLGSAMTRQPLEGYREKCSCSVTLGDIRAEKPIHLDIPITISGMSFGALSGPAKEALGRGANLAGTSTTTGDGGMTPEERGHSERLVYQYLPSRYGMNPNDLRKADAIEIVMGQGAKPGAGGLLLGQKISDRVAEMRNLPKGIDQRSGVRHPDCGGADDLDKKIEARQKTLSDNINTFMSTEHDRRREEQVTNGGAFDHPLGERIKDLIDSKNNSWEALTSEQEELAQKIRQATKGQ